MNSGSEANDMAIMMARLYTGNYDVLALRNGYHGLSEATMGATSHSTWKANLPQVPPALPFTSLPTLLPFSFVNRTAQYSWNARLHG